MTVHGPSVRARYLQVALDTLRREAPGAYARFVEAVGPAERGRIDDAPIVAWLPARLTVLMIRAAADTLGPEATRAFSEKMFLDQFEGPFLQGVTRTVRAVGTAPGSVLRAYARGYPLLYRDCGRVQSHLSEGGATVSFIGLPAVCLEEPAWLDTLPDSIEVALSLAGIEAESAIASVDERSGTVECSVHWGG